MLERKPVDVGLYNGTIPGFDATKFIINDVTLREGEQAANGGLSLDQKMEITRMLADVGIQQVQGGYPGRSAIDREYIKRVRAEKLNIKTEALIQIFTKDWKQQIDIAVETGADVIGMMHPSSDIRLEYQGMTRQDLLAHCKEAVSYAKGKLEVTRFSTTDSYRTELSFLKQIYETVIEAGANRILVTDTVGGATPEGFHYLVKEIHDTFPEVPLAIHVHNDFGMAVANAMAGVRAGATIVDASVSGIGERAGNAPIAEVITALKFLYGLDVPYKVEKLCELARVVERVTEVRIPGEKPIVGADVFAHKLDAHVAGVYFNRSLYEPFYPELVGNKMVIKLGKYSGPFAIRQKAKELGLGEIGDDSIKRVIREVEDLSIELHRSLTDEEFIKIVTEQ